MAALVAAIHADGPSESRRKPIDSALLFPVRPWLGVVARDKRGHDGRAEMSFDIS
jgi:hypothetical protein